MKCRHVFDILGAIISAVILFVLADNIEIETTVDKIMVPFTYVCAALCLIAGISMCTPAGRRISAKVDEFSKQEREVTMAKFRLDPFRITLRKVVVNQLPVLVALAVLYLAGMSISLSVLLIAWCVVVLSYFLITYFYFKARANKKN